jgi:cystathionine beta-lyase/cystathionine gamma-synthase
MSNVSKYLGGHSDIQCGIAVTTAALARQIRRKKGYRCERA